MDTDAPARSGSEGIPLNSNDRTEHLEVQIKVLRSRKKRNIDEWKPYGPVLKLPKIKARWLIGHHSRHLQGRQ